MKGDPLAGFEARYIESLRVICETIGYGRVEQLASDWMEEKHPGHKRACDEVAAERVTSAWRCANCKRPMQFYDGLCCKCFGGDPGQ